MPGDFTKGSLTKAEQFNRQVRDILVGMGFQEMIYNYLGSKKDFAERMNMDSAELVQVANPMTENYEYVRNSIMPCLLASEAVSGNAAYPHMIFETGKITRRDKSDNYGSVTRNYLGFMAAERDCGINQGLALIGALFYYLGKEYSLEESRDPRFIPGRVTRIMSGETAAGIVGEVHPEVLANWGIQMPCVIAELDLDAVRESVKTK
jgi:phenylalanyl-tRNA synthetase beta chain